MFEITKLLFGNQRKTRPAQKKSAPLKKRPLRFEEREDRRLLSVDPALGGMLPVMELAGVTGNSWVVNTVSDVDTWMTSDNILSLREAISRASAGDTITFSNLLRGQTIFLNDNQLTIDKSLTIDASSLYNSADKTPGITIDASRVAVFGKMRSFSITGGTEQSPVSLIGLKVTGGGAAYGGGGGINNSGTLIITNCTVTDNSTGNGGGIYNSNRMIINNCIISENVASYGGEQGGGGIYNSGTLTMTDTILSGNKGENGYGGGGVCNDTGALTMTNCVISKNATASFCSGGGILNRGGIVTITDCFIAGNSAGSGGGICNGGIFTITHCTISENTRGGGMNNSYGTVTMNDSIITANTGSGIFDYNGTTTMTNCSVTKNTNGGISTIGDATNDGPMTLVNCIISENTASSTGGGITNWDGTVILINCTVSRNSIISKSSSLEGGGITNYDGTMIMKGCLVSDNKLSSSFPYTVGGCYGGGISNSGILSMVNCAVLRNSIYISSAESNSYGGGIYNNDTLTLVNCTVAGNTSSVSALDSKSCGGGVYTGASAKLTLNNTIVALNSAALGNDIYCEKTRFSLCNAYNTLSSFSEWDTSVSNYIYDPAKPLFADAKNGDYSLAANSQAINRGNNTYVVDLENKPIQTDLAGKARIANGVVDLGAYEYQGKTLTPLAAPTNLAVSATGSTSIKVSWTAVSGAAGYVIQYAKNSSFSSAQTKTVSPGSAASATLTGLSSGTTYYIRILAKGNGTTTADSGYSATKSAATTSNLPTKPTNVKISDYNPSRKTGTVTWTAVAGATGYMVQYSNDGSKWTNKTVRNVTSFKLTQATPDVIVRVYATNAWGTSAGYGQAAKIAKILPAAVRSAWVQTYNATKNTATVAWSPVACSSPITGYNISYYNSSNRLVTKTVRANLTSINLTRLSRTNLTVLISAVNVWGTSSAVSVRL